MVKCMACGFWKINEFQEIIKCKRCGFINKPEETIQQKIKEDKNEM